MYIRLILAAVFAAASLGLAAPSSAWAGPISLAPVVYSDDFQEKLTEDYGVREGAYLSRDIERALARALERVGGTVSDGAPVTIEVTLVDAKPNRPTFQQLGDRPGLDFGRSISIGGAELRGVIRRGEVVLGEVAHRYYETDIRNVVGLTTWGDARRAIDRFARKVAEEYARVVD